MLDKTYIRDNPELAKRRLAAKGFDLDLGLFEAIDRRERAIRVESEELRSG